ncbi:MAG: non-hydrolyzing UDP-N-acetylglucosamine 2-epimerase [Bacteriovoracaceae bacterium]
MKKILLVLGTRPEAIKMAPVYRELKESKYFETKILVTAQHRQMLDQVLELFQIKPDYDLNLMKPNQDLTDITAQVLQGCRDIFKAYGPDLVCVHGDTTTSMAAALAAFYQRIDVAHIEAGLRTYDQYSPYPEEINRQFTSRIAKFHFAPTEQSKENLLSEKIPEDLICTTGNTVIDALLDCSNLLESGVKISSPYQITAKKFILITGHRRENFGEGFYNICQAIKELALKFPEIDFVYPVHLNPNVRGPVNKILSNQKNIHLIEPQDYLPFVHLMKKAYLILTDSGGIQEEAPSLGKPVLVMRNTTERPEALKAGLVKLVGSSQEVIVKEVEKLIMDKIAYSSMTKAQNPYGDGKASQRIREFLEKKLSQ